MRRLVRRPPRVATPERVDDFLLWATLGVVLGGRLGYVLFYQPGFYFAHPAQIVAVWHGGMSFHGGLIGAAVAIILFCRRHRISVLGFADRLAVCAPIGLGLGRVANFINGKLWGRLVPGCKQTSCWWPGSMIFPQAGPPNLPRYPSELYEAFLEGVILFVVMLLLARRERLRAHRIPGRNLSGRLRRLPHRRRMLPPARRLPRLHRRRADNGADPLIPPAVHRWRADMDFHPARTAAGEQCGATGLLIRFDSPTILETRIPRGAGTARTSLN